MDQKDKPVVQSTELKPQTSAPAFGVLLGVRRAKSKTEVAAMQGCVATRPKE